MLMRALFVHTAHETAGAARIRHSLRPLTTEGVRVPANLGRITSRECEGVASRHAGARVARARNPFLRAVCGPMDSGFSPAGCPGMTKEYDAHQGRSIEG